MIPYEDIRAIFSRKFIKECLHIAPGDFYFILSGMHQPSAEEKDRLDFMLQILQHLKGKYNDRGIRKWFYRKRRLLGGKRPYDFLTDKWTSADHAPRRVMHLASGDFKAQKRKWGRKK